MKKVKGSAFLGIVLMVSAITTVYLVTTKISIEQNKIKKEKDNQVRAQEMAEMGMDSGLQYLRSALASNPAIEATNFFANFEYGYKESGIVKKSVYRGFDSKCQKTLPESLLDGGVSINNSCPYYLMAVLGSVVIKPGESYYLPEKIQEEVMVVLPIRSGSGAQIIVGGFPCLEDPAGLSSIYCQYDSNVISLNFRDQIAVRRPEIKIINTGSTPLDIGKGYLTVYSVGYSSKKNKNSFVNRQIDVYGLFSSQGDYAKLNIIKKNATTTPIKNNGLIER